MTTLRSLPWARQGALLLLGMALLEVLRGRGTGEATVLMLGSLVCALLAANRTLQIGIGSALLYADEHPTVPQQPTGGDR
jgi:hypothetical protein